MYNVSLPYSIFGEIPTSPTLDTFEHAADDSSFSMQLKKAVRYHARVMTAPNPLFHRSTNTCKLSSPLATVEMKENDNMSSMVSNSATAAVPLSPLDTTPIPNNCSSNSNIAAFASKAEENYDFYNYLTHQQQTLTSLPNIDTNNLSFETASISSQQHLLNTNFEDLGTTSFDEDLPPLSADTLYTSNTMQATPIDYHHHAMTTFEKPLYANNLLTPDLIMDHPSTGNTTTAAFISGQSNLSISTATNQQKSPLITSATLNTASIYDVFTPEEIQQPPESCSITPTQDENDITPTSQENNTLQQRDYFCSMETTSSHLTLLQQQLQLHNETASNIILNSNALSSMLLLHSPPSPQQQQQQQQQQHKISGGTLRKKSVSSIKKQQENADYNSDSSTTSGSSYQSSSKKRRYYISCPI